MADATGFNANADMARGRIDDRQVDELQLARAHRLHSPIGGLRRRHGRLPFRSAPGNAAETCRRAVEKLTLCDAPQWTSHERGCAFILERQNSVPPFPSKGRI